MNIITKRVVAAAKKVDLVIVENKTIRELYDYYEPTLAEKATLRRVSLFTFGSGRRILNPEERFEAVTIINDRFEERFEQR